MGSAEVQKNDVILSVTFEPKYEVKGIISLTCVIALYTHLNVSFIPASSVRQFFCFSPVGEAQMADCDSCSIKLGMEPQLLGKVYSCCLIQPRTCISATLHLLIKLNGLMKKKIV